MGRPIFVAGTYRSGTTLLRFILDSHSNIACPPETAFLEHLRTMVDDPRSAAGFEAMGFSRAHVVGRARLFASYYYDNYAASWGKPRWADKSPQYVAHLDWLLELFPSAQFVSIIRHPLDQVHSHTKGGTYTDPRLTALTNEAEDPRLGGARYWDSQVRSQLDFEDRNPAVVHRVRYEDMTEAPEVVLRPLFDFLGEPWEAGVLDFNAQPHDFGLEDDRARTTRSFIVNSGQYRDWPSEVRERSFAIVEETAARAGWQPDR